jgi:hypothetical protein
MNDFFTPLELLNLYYSDGRCAGNKENKLWQKMNSLLSWDNLLHLGYQRDLCPLLFFIITKALPRLDNSILQNEIVKGKIISESMLCQFQTHYQISLTRNMILLDELKRIKKEFQENNIVVVILKGGFLVENVYEDIACRPMGDLDILVREKDKEESYKVLLNMGYKTQKKISETYSTSLHRSFCKKVKGTSISIEIHHRLIKEVFTKNLNLENIYLRRNIPLEYQLLYLSWHGIRHGLYRFLWLCDLAEIIKNNKDSIKWDVAQRKGLDFNIQKQFLFAIHLTRILLLPLSSDNKNSLLSHVSQYVPGLLFLKIQRKILKRKDETQLRYLLSIYLMKWKELIKFFSRYQSSRRI